MSEQETGALTGAAQGAITGAQIAGPYGAVVGAVIGAVGGAIGGGQAKKARKYANKAKALQRAMSLMDAGIQRRDMVRAFRIGRAESVAASAASGEGGLLSSAPIGAISSLGSQFKFNLRYFDQRIRDFMTMQSYVDKAGKYANKAATTGAIMGALNSAASAYGAMKPVTPSQAPSQYGPYSTGYQFPNNSPAVSSTSWTSNYISNIPGR